MKKKTIVLTAVVAALLLSAGCVTAFAAGNDSDAAAPSEAGEESAYSYLAGRQNSTNRNDLYAQAEELPEEDRDAFLAENGIGETPWSEEAAASYSYVGGRQRGASYHR